MDRRPVTAPSAGSRIVTSLCAIAFLGSALTLVRVVLERADPGSSAARRSPAPVADGRATGDAHTTNVHELEPPEADGSEPRVRAAAAKQASQLWRIVRWQEERRAELEARADKQRAEALATERTRLEAERDACRKQLITSWLRERAARRERRDTQIAAETQSALPTLLSLRGRDKVAAGDAWNEGDFAQTGAAASSVVGWAQHTRPGGSPLPLPPGPSVASPGMGRTLLPLM